jgi:hypothetical protein
MEFTHLLRLYYMKTIISPSNDLLVMEKKTLYSETVKGASSTYFFDLSVAQNGKPYLSIVESRKGKDGAFERMRMMILSQDFEKFAAALEAAVTKSKETLATNH